MRLKPLSLGVSILLALATTSDSIQASVRLATLHKFHKLDHPTGRLLQDKDGNFYGTASGTLHFANNIYVYTPGTVFKISPRGELLWQSRILGQNNIIPVAGLFQDEQGFLYGSTFYGGIDDKGVLFKMSADGKFVWSQQFHGLNGSRPYGELVRGCDGSLFGTTLFGGQWGSGTVFRLTSAGIIQTIYSFRGYDGAQPSGGLVRGDDGYFYGTTRFGGPWSLFPFGTSQGTIFRMSCDGALTTLHVFGTATNIGTVFEIQGTQPTGQLIQRNDGCFYGVTEGGRNTWGTNLSGTVFKFDPNGTLSTLLCFNNAESDSANPAGPLVAGYDGSLYGATTYGGASVDDDLPGYGTIFKITPVGTFLNVVSFHGTNGCNPFSGPIKGRDGNLYGTTYGNPYGLDAFAGTFFRLSISRPVVSIARPPEVVHPTNAVVTVTGQTRSRADVLDVYYQLNGGDWAEATTTNEWKNWIAIVTLGPGKNVLRAYAIDSAGDMSRTNRVKLVFGPP